MAGQVPDAGPTPNVGATQLPTPMDSNRVSPDEFGAGVGAQAEQQGRSLSDTAQQIQARHNYAADENWMTQAYGAVEEGVRDPNTGFMALRGQDALEKLGQARDALSAKFGKIRDSLTDAQRMRIGFRLDRVEKEGRLDLESWASRQGRAVAEAAVVGAEKMAGDRLIQLSGDPGTDPTRIKQAMLELATVGEKKAHANYGDTAPPTAVKAEVLKVFADAVPKAMSEAASTGDPARIQAAYDLFKPYLGVHANYYAGVVGKVQSQHAINFESERILGASIRAIPLPDGTTISQVDETKAAAELAQLDPGSPNRADIESRTNTKVKALADVYSKTTAQIFAEAERQGTDPNTGAFSMARVPASLKQWLQNYSTDPKKDGLIALRALDAKAQRIDTGEDRKVSGQNYSSLMAELVDPVLRKQKFATMSADEFTSYLRDEARFPGGFTTGKGSDEVKALQRFKAIKDAAGRLGEPVAKAVPEIIKGAYPGNKKMLDKYAGPLTDALNDFIDEYKTKNKGVAPSSEEVRKFGASEFAQGKVTAAGEKPGWLDVFNSNRRIDVERNVGGKYSGMQFTPADGGATVTPFDPEIAKARSRLRDGESLVRAPNGKFHGLRADETLPDGWSVVK